MLFAVSSLSVFLLFSSVRDVCVRAGGAWFRGCYWGWGNLQLGPADYRGSVRLVCSHAHMHLQMASVFASVLVGRRKRLGGGENSFPF